MTNMYYIEILWRALEWAHRTQPLNDLCWFFCSSSILKPVRIDSMDCSCFLSQSNAAVFTVYLVHASLFVCEFVYHANRCRHFLFILYKQMQWFHFKWSSSTGIIQSLWTFLCLVRFHILATLRLIPEFSSKNNNNIASEFRKKNRIEAFINK